MPKRTRVESYEPLEDATHSEPTTSSESGPRIVMSQSSKSRMFPTSIKLTQETRRQIRDEVWWRKSRDLPRSTVPEVVADAVALLLSTRVVAK